MAGPMPKQGAPPEGKQWSDILPLNRKEPGCRDDRAVKVVSGRGFRHVVPFPYKLQYVFASYPGLTRENAPRAYSIC